MTAESHDRTDVKKCSMEEVEESSSTRLLKHEATSRVLDFGHGYRSEYSNRCKYSRVCETTSGGTKTRGA